MKTIGLIGGTGWISTAEYYRLINEGVNRKLGGQEFSRCMLYSLNYGDIARYSAEGRDEDVYRLMEMAARHLDNGGAEVLAICANTAHIYHDRLSRAVNVPILHIADATADAILRQDIHSVGLLGTRMTMEGTFYQEVLSKYGISTRVPGQADRQFIHDVIFRELFHADFRESSRKRFLQIIGQLADEGARGVVLGCTEIPLLIRQEHTSIPLFNTLEIHAGALVDFALDDL